MSDVWTENQAEPHPRRDTSLSWVANFLMAPNIIISPTELQELKDLTYLLRMH